MARFIGKVKGGRGEASRLGHSTSGLRVSADGWNIGATIYAKASGDYDRLEIHLGGGSNSRGIWTGTITFEQDSGGYHLHLGHYPGKMLAATDDNVRHIMGNPELVELLRAKLWAEARKHFNG